MKTVFAIALAAFALLGISQPVLADEYSGCNNCGVVKKIEVYTEKRSGTAGAVVGGIVGGAVGNQVGSGDGKKVATVAGVVGGAIVGKKIAEKNDKKDYEITVRMDNGQTRVIDQGSIGKIKVGSRVKIKNNKVLLRQ
ncbi:MAG: glycine zipper 2TM domain-containing protein [Arenimonas sp.]